MSHLLNAIGDFVSAIMEFVTGIFNTIFGLFTWVFNTIFTFISSFLHVIATTFKGVFDVAGETGKFVLSNLFMIILVAGGAFAFLYFRNQGKTITVTKKKA